MQPDTADIANYLNAGGLTSFSDEEIASTLASEAVAQSHACTLPAAGIEWPADLQEALRRRVARALALRKLPLAIVQNDVANTRISGTDPEVRRLEAFYRRVVVA